MVQGSIHHFQDTDVGHAVLAAVLDYWHSRRGDLAMPPRAELDPLHLPPRVWPYLVLMAVERDEGWRFRYRLIGTHVVDSLGRDSTGRYIHDVQSSDLYEDFVAGLKWTAENGKPLRSIGSASFVEKEWLSFEAVNLPLSDDGISVDKILMPVVYAPAPAHEN